MQTRRALTQIRVRPDTRPAAVPKSPAVTRPCVLARDGIPLAIPAGMRRYLFALVLALALLASALLVPASPAGAAGAGTPVITPQGTFSHDVISLHRRGWRLVDYSIRYDDTRNEVVVLQIVLTNGRHAERFKLGFSEWGDRASEYVREPVDLPAAADQRVYPGEAALFTALAASSSLRLSAGCSDYTLDAGGQYVDIAEHDYYVVTDSATGRDARRKLATTLSSAIGAGMDLTSIRSVDAPDGRWVELALADGTGLVVRARLDEGGEVVAMESRTTPTAYAWERVRSAGRLARALQRNAAEIRAIAFDEQASRLTLTLDGRRRIAVDTSDVEPTEYADHADGDCGC
jgi:hypothetical protein